MQHTYGTHGRAKKLVDQLESLMRTALWPEYQGCYGQLVLSGDAPTGMGKLKDVRRAAHKAGRRLGWKTTTHLVGGRHFVLEGDRAAGRGCGRCCD
ncbi:hypothetical protein [Streptomyces mirabilis]|uniref:hypothetical protein n=1 Tax=Streptomyces mirabilis TaxID=68239 RepID=UPI002255ED0B|nr:hypothetical protein [Streptomyces mirabilis]MCX4426012.1 hypothetical protein [Streptomyces mirabilis]